MSLWLGLPVQLLDSPNHVLQRAASSALSWDLTPWPNPVLNLVLPQPGPLQLSLPTPLDSTLTLLVMAHKMLSLSQEHIMAFPITTPSLSPAVSWDDLNGHLLSARTELTKSSEHLSKGSALPITQVRKLEHQDKHIDEGSVHRDTNPFPWDSNTLFP